VIKMELVEQGIGLKPTKLGASGKKKAYLVSSGNVQRAGLFLLVVSIACVIVGLSMKSELNAETEIAVRKQNNAFAHKKALFRTKRMSVMGEKAQEAKLIKIMSVLEQHLGRDRQEGDMFQAFEGRFDQLLDQHKVDVKKALSMLEGNPTLVNGLTTLLSNHAVTFKRNILKVTQKYGEQIQEESMAAEQRLKDASDALVTELNAEVGEQKRLTKEDEETAQKDPQWKQLEEDFKKGPANKKTQDEKDVHNMINNFEEKVSEINAPDLTENQLRKAEELQERLAHAKPEEVPGIQEEMKKMADEAGMFFISIKDGDEKETIIGEVGQGNVGEVSNEFNEMVDEAKFAAVQEPIKKELNEWMDKKKSDADVMRDIEQKVSDGEINPAWLHAGEKKPDAEAMLKMDQASTNLKLPGLRGGDKRAPP